MIALLRDLRARRRGSPQASAAPNALYMIELSVPPVPAAWAPAMKSRTWG